MQKALFLVLIAIVPFAQSASATTLEQHLSNHAQALAALEPHIPSIKIQSWVSYSPHQTTYHYNYTCPTQEIQNLLDTYLTNYNALTTHIILHRCAHGAILGAALACWDRHYHNGAHDTKRSAAIGATLACLSLYRNYSYGPIHSLNARLEKTDNFYGLGHVLLETGIASFAAGGSYLLTNWIAAQVAS